MLQTEDFGCWEAAVSTTLGHHRSDLLTPASPFRAHFRIGQLGAFTVLHVQGSGRLRMLLIDPSQDHRRVMELMAAAGLIASGVTSADYRHWCGESPSQTRLRRLGRESDPADEA